MSKKTHEQTKDDSLSLNQMRTFLNFTQTGSQVRAAQALKISQTSVSRYVKHVQDHFGGGLFASSKGAELTDRGILVERTLRSVTERLDETRERLANERPVLRIGFIRAVRPLVERVLRDQGRREEALGFDVRLFELTSEQQARKLQNRELEVAICYAMDHLFVDRAGIQESAVTEQPFALVVPERALLRGKLAMRALPKLDYAHLPRRFSTQAADAAVGWLERHGLQPRSSIECALGTEIIAYAATGRGYGFLPALWSTASHEGAAFVPVPGFAYTARIVAYSLEHTQPWASPLRERFVKAAKTALQEFERRR